MNAYSEILRYMGHSPGQSSGASAGIPPELEELVSSCLEKLISFCSPRHVIAQLPCEAGTDCVTIGSLKIGSSSLAAHLSGCSGAYVFAATLGADVDRLIAQRSKLDSAEALCVQACAAVRIEEYCDGVERELSNEVKARGLHLRSRFSPGYGDFDIAHQTDILNMLNAHKRIGLGETKSHMLVPLKSVTAVIGAGPPGIEYPALSPRDFCAKDKCAGCNKADCLFRAEEPKK